MLQPRSSKDWKIIEMNADFIQQNFWAQVKAVSKDQDLCIFLSDPPSEFVRLHVVDISSLAGSSLEHGELCQDTQLCIEPCLSEAIEAPQDLSRLPSNGCATPKFMWSQSSEYYWPSPLYVEIRTLLGRNLIALGCLLFGDHLSGKSSMLLQLERDWSGRPCIKLGLGMLVVRGGLSYAWKSLHDAIDSLEIPRSEKRDSSFSSSARPLLLLDDLDVLLPNPYNKSEHDVSAPTLAGLAHQLSSMVNLLIQKGVHVIATSSSEASLHPTFMQWSSPFLDHQWTISCPSYQERSALLTWALQHQHKLQDFKPSSVGDDHRLQALVALTLNKHVPEVLMLSQKYLEMGENILGLSELVAVKSTKVSVDNVHPDLAWDQIQAPSLMPVKNALKALIIDAIHFKQVYDLAPIRLPSGILLYGMPGTGKSMLLKALLAHLGLGADESCKLKQHHKVKVNCIMVNGPELLGKYIGSSEQAVRDVFSRARTMAPCVIFFDEFESLVPKRGTASESSGVADRIVNQFLTELDGLEAHSLNKGVFVVAASNHPHQIDPAVLRPGRIDRHLHLPLPDYGDRKAILVSYAEKYLGEAGPNNNNDNDIPHDDDVVGQAADAFPLIIDQEKAECISWSYFACKTEGFTGADLHSLFYNAQLEAMHDSKRNLMMHEISDGSHGNKGGAIVKVSSCTTGVFN